jgi:methylmalonyl-CoA/ethylmalonyl-CoA epimerase
MNRNGEVDAMSQGSPGPPAGALSRIHHVGVAVRDIDAALKELADLYGYAACSPLIHDPVQTAFARFLRRPGERSCVELVTPDGPASRLAGALKRGGGLNHLCYAAADIVATCRRLREGGMVVIQEPVPAAAFPGRRIAWLMGVAGLLTELVEEGTDTWEEAHEHRR